MVVKNNKNKYTHLDLGREITDLNEIQHRFSLVAIKDTFNEHPNRFLLYYNEDRVYDHRVYYAEIFEYKDNITKDEFEIDGKKFFWMTIQQMERDKRISEVNSDVVGLIKGVIG